MSNDKAAPSVDTDNEYAWFKDGNAPHSREDRIAEALARVALLFSLCIGIVIALLPVSAKAASPATPTATLELPASKVVPATPGHPEQRVAATESHAGDQLE